jgi:hypothetical protein
MMDSFFEPELESLVITGAVMAIFSPSWDSLCTQRLEVCCTNNDQGYCVQTTTRDLNPNDEQGFDVIINEQGFHVHTTTKYFMQKQVSRRTKTPCRTFHFVGPESARPRPGLDVQTTT